MSFHGGFLGVVISVWFLCRHKNLEFSALVDFIAPLAPIGLALGRLGNFINQELWGRPVDVPWAMVFPFDPSGLARHPSQLYQFAMEGLLLFFILYWYTRERDDHAGRLQGYFSWVTAYFDRLPSSSVSLMPT